MSRQQVNELKPFFSILIIIGTLFSVVFFKMEVRRMGYSVLKQVREYKSLQDHQRLQLLEYARYTSPAQLRRVAQARLTLEDARLGQIIHISGNQIALRQ